MLPRSQGRQIHTATPHRAHVKTRASAAATALAARGLYKSRRARDPVAGYPVQRTTAAAGDTRRPGIQPGPPPSAPLLLCLPHLRAPKQSAPRHLRWVTSDEHTPGVSRERLRKGVRATPSQYCSQPFRSTTAGGSHPVHSSSVSVRPWATSAGARETIRAVSAPASPGSRRRAAPASACPATVRRSAALRLTSASREGGSTPLARASRKSRNRGWYWYVRSGCTPVSLN